MNTSTAEVISLPVHSIGKDIHTFIQSQTSKHTKESYTRSIKYFFKYTRNKDIEDLSIRDMLFRNTDILAYKNHLAEKYDSASSANANLSAVFSLYKQLEKDYAEIEYKTIKVDFFKNNAEPHGKITQQEAEEMSLLAKEEVNGFEKYCLIRLAWTISVRKSALLRIKYSDIVQHPEDSRFYVIRGVDKGEKRFKATISKDLYETLLQLKEVNKHKNYNDELIFHISDSTIHDTMNRIKTKMGISPERNVTFHSLRSIGAIHAVRMQGDIKLAQKILGHADVSMTLKKYVDDSDDDYLNAPSILMEQKIDDGVFDELDRDELLRLIKSQTAGSIVLMKNAAKKIIESRE